MSELYFNKNKKIMIYAHKNRKFALRYYKCRESSPVFFFAEKRTVKTFLTVFSREKRAIENGAYATFVLKGVGYYFYKHKNLLFLDIGYSNFICITMPPHVYVQRFRYRAAIFSHDLSAVNRITHIILRAKKRNVYKGKGVFLANEEIKLKIVNKKN